MKRSKNAVAFPAATTTTTGSARTTVERDPTRKRKPDDTVGTMDRTPRGKKGDKPQDQFDKILHNKRCPIHPKSNHSMWECTILRKSFQSAPTTTPKKEQDKDDEDDKKDRDGFQQQQNVVNDSVTQHTESLRASQPGDFISRWHGGRLVRYYVGPMNRG